MRPRRESRLTSFSPPPGEREPEKAAAPEGHSVTEVMDTVNRLLARDGGLNDVWIRGEISGFKAAASGHWYFDLKDEKSCLNGAMFRGANARVQFQPEDGMDVLVRGEVKAYAPRSTVQVVVREMRTVGVGDLAVRFEQLKRRLAAEGLFDAARKQDLPPYPARIGIVTSLQAAALRDMVRVATSRHPGVRLVVAHTLVQGMGSAESIAAAVAHMAQSGDVDVIIVGRGGGSLEDLWAFNEEVVVRAVAASPVPVVSAVGHETDVTLCDLAADLRAATPSNAAELVVPDAEAMVQWLDDCDERLRGALARLVPDTRDGLDQRLARAERAMRTLLTRSRDGVEARMGRLGALSPLKVLDRGYAVARLREGEVVRGVEGVAEGDPIEVLVKDGIVDAKVTRTRKEGPHVRD